MDRMLLDVHTHSDLSPDAESPLENMYKTACELGLRVYAVTDHCECNFWEEAENDSITDAMMYGAKRYALQSIKAQYELKQRYSGSTEILVGIELGQPEQARDKAQIIENDKRLDFIIGSHHMNSGCDDFYYLDYSKMSSEQINTLLEDHFRQTLTMCRTCRFDVLGHLTYPLRYICGEQGLKVSLKQYDDIIAEIFRELIDKGRGIEINTSGLRQKYGLTFPELGYVRLFRDLGGRIVTLGSDAHRTADIGKGISQGVEIAQAAGFDRIAYFKQHQPEFIRL